MELSIPRPVIIDTDAGIDDTWALFMMLAAHQNPKVDIKIEAITCVFGNTGVGNVTKNVTRILQTAKETNIPVFRGASSALEIEFHEEPPFHGHDGLGDADLPAIEPLLETEYAVSALIRLADQYEKGTLSILALGPLTNLATAIRTKPEIRDKFQEILILGGNLHAKGNVTVCGEFNFVKDAEAAKIVLEHFKCPIRIVPLETFHLVYNPSFREFRDKLLAPIPSDQMKLLNTIEAGNLKRDAEIWAAADTVAAAVFIEPQMTTKSEPYYCTVELNGSFTRGMMVVDKRNKLNLPPNAIVITDIDVELYKKIVIAGVGGPYYKN